MTESFYCIRKYCFPFSFVLVRMEANDLLGVTIGASKVVERLGSVIKD